MFSGIIESIGKVVDLKKEKGNLHISIRSPFTNELKIDQSIAHNGACLTVISIHEDIYVVTAIDETLQKTNLGVIKIGDAINLERCMKLGDRLDGHIIQINVDKAGTCLSVGENNGSPVDTLNYDAPCKNITG